MLLLLLRTQVPILDLESRKYLGMVSALDLAAYVARYVQLPRPPVAFTPAEP
jgi:hypothetical protein